MRDLLAEIHRPVLVGEVLANLRFKDDQGVFVDATVGLGGHTEAVLERFARVSVVGVDIDKRVLELCRRRLARFGDRVKLVCGSYEDLDLLVLEAGFGKVDSILFDTGLSGYLCDGDLASERGFSFAFDGPLDMRYDQSSDRPSAKELVNRLSAQRLGEILRGFGQVPWASSIARAIVQARGNRKIETTGQLAEVLRRAVGRRLRGRKIESLLAKVFQALRFAVNRELDVLQAGLEKAVDLLASGGRLLVICYESLTHAVAKRVFRQAERGCICPDDAPICTCGKKPRLRIVTKRSIGPSKEEIAQNPRSRSARLRVAQRV